MQLLCSIFTGTQSTSFHLLFSPTKMQLRSLSNLQHLFVYPIMPIGAEVNAILILTKVCNGVGWRAASDIGAHHEILCKLSVINSKYTLETCLWEHDREVGAGAWKREGIQTAQGFLQQWVWHRLQMCTISLCWRLEAAAWWSSTWCITLQHFSLTWSSEHQHWNTHCIYLCASHNS